MVTPAPPPPPNFKFCPSKLTDKNFPIWCNVNFEPVYTALNNTNQRTSGPVNAHLTPGPGIYFNVFMHVYSPRVGAVNPLGTNVDVNRKPLSLCPFVAGLKKLL